MSGGLSTTDFYLRRHFSTYRSAHSCSQATSSHAGYVIIDLPNELHAAPGKLEVLIAADIQKLLAPAFAPSLPFHDWMGHQRIGM